MKTATAAAEAKSNADVEPCLSVVMPVYNEAATVGRVLALVLEQRLLQEEQANSWAAQRGFVTLRRVFKEGQLHFAALERKTPKQN
jgi:hypothetical protein